MSYGLVVDMSAMSSTSEKGADVDGILLGRSGGLHDVVPWPVRDQRTLLTRHELVHTTDEAWPATQPAR